MSRRRKGLKHMIWANDKTLDECYPENISWDQYLVDLEKAINTSELYSDEWSSSDEELANKEKDNKTRPERLNNSNSVIKIYDKKWRSTRVCNVLK